MNNVYGGCDNCHRLLKLNDDYINFKIPNIGNLMSLQFCDIKCLTEIKQKYPYLENYNDYQESKIEYCDMEQNRRYVIQAITKFPEYFLEINQINPTLKEAVPFIKLLLDILQKEEMELTKRENDFIKFCEDICIIIS